jgi:hypothetical protein
VDSAGQRFLVSQPAAVGAAGSGSLAEQVAQLADQGGAAATSTAATPYAVTVVLNWPQLLNQK